MEKRVKIGIVVLFLNCLAKILSEQPSFGTTLLILFLSFPIIVIIFSIFLLCRLHARRQLRDDKLYKIEERISQLLGGIPLDRKIASITDSKQVTRTAEKSDPLIYKKLGKYSTSMLCIMVLLVLLLLYIVLACFAYANYYNSAYIFLPSC